MSKNTARKWWILIGCGIAGIMVPVDFTIVNTCLSPIQQALNLPLTQLQWVMTGFGITFCALLAVMGRFADIFGRRKILYFGMVGFALASLGAGFSDSSLSLIIYRVLQGAFGATIFPSGFGIVADAFPQEEHGFALGAFGACMGIGLALGPVLGGIIASTIGWRWIFFINIPTVLVSFLICLPTVGESRIQEKIGIDYLGMILLIACLACLVFGISEGATLGWSSSPVLSTLIASAILFILLIIVEAKRKDALLPLRLFSNTGFLLGALTYSLIIGFSWVIIFLNPLYLHDVLGFDTLKTGLMLIPMTGMTFIAAYLAGYLYDKIGARFVVFLMLILAVASYVMQLFFNADTSIWYIFVAFFLFGTSWGLSNGVGVPFAVSQMSDSKDTGVISGAAITILNIAGVVILAVSTTVFHYAEQHHLHSLLSNKTALSPTVRNTLQQVINNPDNAGSLMDTVSGQAGQHIMQLFYHAFLHGFVTAILILLIITLVLAPITLLLSFKLDRFLKNTQPSQHKEIPVEPEF